MRVDIRCGPGGMADYFIKWCRASSDTPGVPVCRTPYGSSASLLRLHVDEWLAPHAGDKSYDNEWQVNTSPWKRKARVSNPSRDFGSSFHALHNDVVCKFHLAYIM